MNTRRPTATTLLTLTLAAATLLIAVAGGLLSMAGVALAAVAPTVEAESFSDAGSSSVTTTARIDAQGSLTTYYFEYGPSTAYGSATTPTSLGAGSEGAGAPTQLEGRKAKGGKTKGRRIRGRLTGSLRS